MRRTKKICLNMIVKNESHVIKRCLRSVKHLLDYWVIVDTGSTDGTQEIIREFLRDIPGELHERPWVNFGHNRNEALTLARGKAEYILFIDADDRLVFAADFVLPKLQKDFYVVMQQNAGTSNPVLLMIKDLPDFAWTGALHEHMTSPHMAVRSYELLNGIVNEYLHDGARAKDPSTEENDIALLKKALREEPKNQIYHFYLARIYRGRKDYKAAVHFFKNASGLQGRQDIAFHSLLSIARLQETLKSPPDKFLKSYCLAFARSPFRVEPLYEMARYFLQKGNDFLAYLIAKMAVSIPLPPSPEMLVEAWMYEWGAKEQWRQACEGLTSSPS